VLKKKLSVGEQTAGIIRNVAGEYDEIIPITALRNAP
jgi:hypothetical protein